MYARAVDEASARLRALRREEWEDLALASLALALAVAASYVRPSLAVPLLVGGLAVGILGLRALARRWALIDLLADERDAYVIPEVLAFATREATLERRRTFAALLRRAPSPGCEERVASASEELEALVAELDDGGLTLAPPAAVACLRLVSDLDRSPLLNPALPPDDLCSRVRQIRAGFEAAESRRAALPLNESLA
jgi:hypothetical protein